MKFGITTAGFSGRGNRCRTPWPFSLERLIYGQDSIRVRNALRAHRQLLLLLRRISRELMRTETKSAGWSLIRQQLKDWQRPALIALIKDLHDASSANRDFLQARFQAEDSSGAAL